jgi:hypothetical protein
VALLSSVLAYEVVGPLFIANLLLVWQRARQSSQSNSKETLGYKIAFRLLIGNLIALALAMGYKMLVTNRIMIHEPYFSHILKLIQGAIGINYGDYGIGLLLIVEHVVRNYADLTLTTTGLLLGLVIFLYIYSTTNEASISFLSRANWLAVSVLGFIVFGLGYAVFLLTDHVAFTTTGVSNRTAIAASVGVAFSFVGLIGWVSSCMPSARLHRGCFCLLLTFLAVAGFFINNTIARFWILASQVQQGVIAAVRQHFPSLPDGSTLLLDGVCSYIGPGIVFETDWDVGGMLKMYYHSTELSGDIVRDNIEVKEEGLYIKIYDQKQYYSYNEKLLIYNFEEKKSYQLINAEAARHYFQSLFKKENARESRRWLGVAGGNVAHLVFPSHNSDIVRIAIKKAGTAKSFDIQLNHPYLKVKANQPYSLAFRARADRPRSVFVGFAQAYAPWDGLGLYSKIELTPEWQSFVENFVATADDDNARIFFDVGGNDAPVEVSTVNLHSLLDNAPIDPDFFKLYFNPDYKRNCPKGQEGFGAKIF